MEQTPQETPPKKANFKVKYPPENWPRLCALVEEGKHWIEAAQIIYPEASKKNLKDHLNWLKSESAPFKAFMEKWNGKRVMPQLKAKDILKQLTDIWDFNIADLYVQDAATGEVTLDKDWLAKAKERNVISKISIKKFEKADPKTGAITKTEQVDVEAYSRLTAVGMFCKLKGLYGDTRTSSEKNITNNNTILVGQINSIRDSIQNGTLPKKLLPEMDQKYLDTLVNAKIVDGEKKDDAGADDDS